MPRHDRFQDDLMSRERPARGYREYEDRDRGSAFDEPYGRQGQDRSRGRVGGWGSLIEDESSGGRWPGASESNRSRADNGGGIPREETERLIASDKVEGTPVFDRRGDRLGSIHNFMVDKIRGHVVYAVLKHGGGFLGFDDRFYPLHWDQLRFDTRLGGYRVNLSEDELKSFGSWDREERWSERSDRNRSERQRDRGFRPSRW